MVVSPGSSVLCKVNLDGCYSPLTFHCNIVDTKNADLKIFLSTLHREPNQNHFMRKVDRLKLFKFYQEKKRVRFNDDEICYLNIESNIGCTVTMKATHPSDIDIPSDEDEDKKVVK